MDRMGPSPNLSIIHTVTIGTMLNNNGGNTGHGLKTLHANRHLRLSKISEAKVYSCMYPDFLWKERSNHELKEIYQICAIFSGK